MPTAVCGAPHRSPASPTNCPGGTYSSLEVTGVPASSTEGQVTVTGGVVVDAGRVAHPSRTASAPRHRDLRSQSTVTWWPGRGRRSVLVATPSHLACLTPRPGTDGDHPAVHGSLVATDPLGLVLHDSSVDGDLTSVGRRQRRGMHGGTHDRVRHPAGVRHPGLQHFEDLTVGGDLRVTGLASCWLGALRLTVGGSATFSDDSFADPDADEILNNHIGGNLLCTGLAPAVHFGDAGQGKAARSAGYGTGDCAFSRILPLPAPDAPMFQLPIAKPATDSVRLLAGRR